MQSLAPYCAVDLCVSRQLLLLLIFKVYREPPSTAHSFITNYFLTDTKFHKLVGFFLHFVEMLFSRWRIWKSIIKQTLINLWRLLLTCKKLFLCSWSLMKLKYLCDLNLLASGDWMKSIALRDTARNNFAISSLLFSRFSFCIKRIKKLLRNFLMTRRERPLAVAEGAARSNFLILLEFKAPRW